MIEIGPKARGELGPGLSPYLLIVDQVFGAFGYDCLITHISDGKHGEASLHYIGDAIDVIHVPYKTLPMELANEIRDELSRRLNGFPRSAGLKGDYDVVFEGDHFHIEYQPKLMDSEYREQVDRYLFGG